jgi:putative autoinducer-2 (AI-2) aldolase
VRLNASVLAVQVFIGSEHEKQTLRNMTKLIDSANRYGIAVMGVVAVGTSMERTPKYFRLATRIMAELGCHMVKCYYTSEEFDTITSACPVPLVIAGGKKLPEFEALTMAFNAIQQGAYGVDMGRNIFQSDAPIPMIKAVQKIVHENESVKHAFEYYETLKREALTNI